MEYLTRTIFITARNAAKSCIAIMVIERQRVMSVDIGLVWSNVRRTDMQETIKKTVILESYVQTSYDSYSHIFRTVEIEILDDGNEWHVCGELKEE